MDREIIQQLRDANEACMMLMTLMALDDDSMAAAKLVAEDDRYTERATCMALATYGISATSALAEQLGIPIEMVIQMAATNAAVHTVELEELLEKDEDEGHY